VCCYFFVQKKIDPTLTIVPRQWCRRQQQKTSSDTALNVPKTVSTTTSQPKQVTAHCSDGQQNLNSLDGDSAAKVTPVPSEKEENCTITNILLAATDMPENADKKAKLESVDTPGITLPASSTYDVLSVIALSTHTILSVLVISARAILL